MSFPKDNDERSIKLDANELMNQSILNSQEFAEEYAGIPSMYSHGEDGYTVRFDNEYDSEEKKDDNVVHGEVSFNTIYDIMYEIEGQTDEMRALGLIEDPNKTIRLTEDITRVLSLTDNPESQKIYRRYQTHYLNYINSDRRKIHNEDNIVNYFTDVYLLG